MFFCGDCAENHGYPENFMKSHGPCEICGRTALCNDVPSKYLPPAKGKEDAAEG